MNGRAHLNRRKTLWKLAYATRSIQHVLSACDFYLEHLKHEQHHPMAYSVMCAICVIYARPFTDNSGVGMISSKFGRYTEPRLQRTHDILLRSRMQFYAHSDSTVFATNELGEKSPIQQL